MIGSTQFEHVACIDSTSAELMRRPFSAQSQPACILLADVQEAGRGRNGRSWLSDGDRSLAVSAALERPADNAVLLGLTLAVGVVVADVLARLGTAPRLKWPNDLYLETAAGPAKVGGILTEVRQSGGVQRIVVGVGLNLSVSERIAAAHTGQAVAALDLARIDRPQLAREIGYAILAAVERFVRDGLAPFAEHWRALDLLAGRPVDLIRGDGSREPCVARGIDAGGALVVEFGDGRREACIGGEISVRMAGPPPQ